jgi:hypothetical protein
MVSFRLGLIPLFLGVVACSNNVDSTEAPASAARLSETGKMTFTAEGSNRTFAVDVPSSATPNVSLTRLTMTATAGEATGGPIACGAGVSLDDQGEPRARLQCTYGDVARWLYMTIAFTETSPNHFQVRASDGADKRPDDYLKVWNIVTGQDRVGIGMTFDAVLETQPSDDAKNPLRMMESVRADAEKVGKAQGVFPFRWVANDGYTKARVDKVVGALVDNGPEWGTRVLLDVSWTAIKDNGTEKVQATPKQVAVPFDENAKASLSEQVQANLPDALTQSLRTVNGGGA